MTDSSWWGANEVIEVLSDHDFDFAQIEAAMAGSFGSALVTPVADGTAPVVECLEMHCTGINVMKTGINVMKLVGRKAQ